MASSEFKRLEEDEFYDLAQEDVEIAIDVPRRNITCAGRSFTFELHRLYLRKKVY